MENWYDIYKISIDWGKLYDESILGTIYPYDGLYKDTSIYTTKENNTDNLSVSTILDVRNKLINEQPKPIISDIFFSDRNPKRDEILFRFGSLPVRIHELSFFPDDCIMLSDGEKIVGIITDLGDM